MSGELHANRALHARMRASSSFPPAGELSALQRFRRAPPPPAGELRFRRAPPPGRDQLSLVNFHAEDSKTPHCHLHLVVAEEYSKILLDSSANFYLQNIAMWCSTNFALCWIQLMQQQQWDNHDSSPRPPNTK